MRRCRAPMTVHIASVLALAWTVAGCDDGAFKDTGEKEKKYASGQLPPSADLQKDEDVPVAHARYQIKVNANTGMELCSGVMDLILSTNFDLNPTGQMQCMLIGSLDISDFFGGKAKVAERDDDMKQWPMFGKIVRSQNPVTLAPGHAQFNPPKPSVIGPLIQDPTEYEGFAYSEPSEVQGLTKEGQPYQGSGHWYVKVHGVNMTHRPETYTGNQQFNSVIKWEMNAAGFANTPKASFMGFDSMIYYWNTNPIAVPEITIKAKLADLTAGDSSSTSGLGGIGDMIFSGITISIKLISQEQL